MNRVVMFGGSSGGVKANLTSGGEGRERRRGEANVERCRGGMS